MNTKSMYLSPITVLFGPFSCKTTYSKSLKTDFQFRQGHNYLRTIGNLRCSLIFDHNPGMHDQCDQISDLR